MERSAPTPPVGRTASTPPEDRGLAREAIGLREVFFQSVTHMAPAAAVAFSIIVGANFASGALPLSVLFALVGCLLVAISIGQLAKHLPSAGGFYTYTARGIHPSIGFLVAWGYAFVEPLVAPALYLIFGQVVAGMLQTEFGWSFSTWWWISAIAAARPRVPARLVRDQDQHARRHDPGGVRDRRVHRARDLADRGRRGATTTSRSSARASPRCRGSTGSRG